MRARCQNRLWRLDSIQPFCFPSALNAERQPLLTDAQHVLDGEIQSLVAEKGFGFIKPAVGGADVFFHCSSVDATFETLAPGQLVKYELDSETDKPRARRVQAGEASAHSRPAIPGARPSRDVRPRSTRRPFVREEFEFGFVTKLHRKASRGFISSIKHGPEYVFAAACVTGDKRYWRLEIGDYVQFLVGQTDPEDPKQPVAMKVKVIERVVKIPGAKPLERHPNARKKKPTWR